MSARVHHAFAYRENCADFYDEGVTTQLDLVTCRACLSVLVDTHDDGEGERPHQYRCPGCEAKKVCFGCGAPVKLYTSRCTNFACLECHSSGKCGGHAEGVR